MRVASSYIKGDPGVWRRCWADGEAEVRVNGDVVGRRRRQGGGRRTCAHGPASRVSPKFLGAHARPDPKPQTPPGLPQ